MTAPHLPSENSTDRARMTIAEGIAFVALLTLWVVATPMLAAMSAHLPASHVWSRPLTGDEYHTLLLTREPSVASMIAKLSRGGDFNPPALFIALRPWTALFGTGEVALRSFSTVAIIAGLLGLYLALRNGLGHFAARTAMIAAWGGLPLLQVEAFDARFYALWFAATAWLAATMPAVTTVVSWRTLVVAILAVVVCTTHYFGIVSLACLVAGQFLVERGTRTPIGETLKRLVPLSAGPVALAVCLPLYFGQRATLDVPTWIAPSARAAIEQLIDPFYRSFPLCGAAFALAATVLSRALRRESVLRPATIDVRRFGAALGLIAMPLLMLAFQFLVQPVSVARYAIPATIGVAAVAGVLLVYCDRRIVLAVAAVFLVLPVVTLRLQTDLWDASRQEAPAQLALSLADHVRADRPLVFTQRSAAYTAWHDGGAPADAVRVVVPSDGDEAGVFERVERSVGGRLHGLFGTPAPIDRRELASLRSFVYCGDESPPIVAGRFPEARVGRIADAGPLIAYLVVHDPPLLRRSVDPAAPSG